MNRYRIAGIFFAWLIFGLLHALVLGQYIDLNVSILLSHSLFRSIVFFILSLILNRAVVFGNLSVLPFSQKILNCLLLSVLTVGCWYGLGWLFDSLFLGSEALKIFSGLTAIYISFGLMLYVIILLIIVIQQYKYGTEKDDFPEEISSASLSSAPEEKPEILEQVAVKSNSKIHVIAVTDVYFIASDGDYVMIHTEHSKYMKEQTMKYFENCLPKNFIRIHRSYIVNSEKISRVELLEKQTYYLILKNSQRIKMSAAGYRMLRQKLGL